MGERGGVRRRGGRSGVGVGWEGSSYTQQQLFALHYKKTNIVYCSKRSLFYGYFTCAKVDIFFKRVFNLM